MATRKNKKQQAISTTSSPILASQNPDAEIGLRDSIARNRACTPVAARAIPSVPTSYQPTNADVRRRLLRVVSGELSAEALQALEEIVRNKATFQKDLGELAPSPEPAERLLARVREVDATLVALEALLQFHREIEDIALSDVVHLLEAANTEYEHRVSRLPQLATRYSALARFFEARSAAVSAGIERSRLAKADKALKPVDSAPPA